MTLRITTRVTLVTNNITNGVSIITTMIPTTAMNNTRIFSTTLVLQDQ